MQSNNDKHEGHEALFYGKKANIQLLLRDEKKDVFHYCKGFWLKSKIKNHVFWTISHSVIRITVNESSIFKLMSYTRCNKL